MLVFLVARSYVEARDHERFQELAQRAFGDLDNRTEFYVNYLRTLDGYLASGAQVTAQSMQRFIAFGGFGENHGPMLALGYAQRVPQALRDAHVADIRAQGYRDYSVAGDSLDGGDLYPIVYYIQFPGPPLSPLGWNPARDEARWAAMQTARDTGAAAASKRVDLISRTEAHLPPGFVLYVPHYRGGFTPASLGERRETLEGFVFGSFSVRTLWEEVVDDLNKSPLGLRVYAARDSEPSALLFDSEVDEGLVAAKASHPLSRTVHLRALGQDWTLVFWTRAPFELDSKRPLPWILLVMGSVVSLLLFVIVSVQGAARARAEEMSQELRGSRASLEQEKERLAVTLRAIGDGVVATDIEGRVTLLNKAAEELLGCDPDRALGKPIGAAWRAVPETPQNAGRDLIRDVLETGQSSEDRDGVLQRGHDGRERLLSRSAAPIRGPTGDVVGVVLVFRDITEKCRLESEILKSSKLESLGLLAGGIAHDFNNILMAIVGNLDVARGAVPDGTEARECLQEVGVAAHRARDLTAQLLTFARGGAPVKQSAFIGDVLTDSVRFFSRGANVRCDVRVPSDLRAVDVDLGQITQVFNNLVLNAIQAMPQGGTVQIRAENLELQANSGLPLASGAWVKISIHDQGCGIKPENLTRIFDPYFTTKETGSGLGLSTAYSIVRRHGGLITVESAEGKGANFQVFLPVSKKPVARIRDSQPAERFQGQGRVLLLDDEPTVRRAVARMIERLGYEPEETADGAAAVASYQAALTAGRPFQAVIMDLTIPGGMGGKEAMIRLRQIDPEIRAIVSSGYSTDPVMANYLDHGFRAVIVKPYQIDDLARVLSAVLDGHGGGSDGRRNENPG